MGNTVEIVTGCVGHFGRVSGCCRSLWKAALYSQRPCILQSFSRMGETYLLQCHRASCVDLARNSWPGKPIVMDEIGYEGKGIGFANFGAEMMAKRIFVFLAKGVYAGHSEALLPADDETQVA